MSLVVSIVRAPAMADGEKFNLRTRETIEILASPFRASCRGLGFWLVSVWLFVCLFVACVRTYTQRGDVWDV